MPDDFDEDDGFEPSGGFSGGMLLLSLIVLILGFPLMCIWVVAHGFAQY